MSKYLLDLDDELYERLKSTVKSEGGTLKTFILEAIELRMVTSLGDLQELLPALIDVRMRLDEILGIDSTNHAAVEHTVRAPSAPSQPLVNQLAARKCGPLKTFSLPSLVEKAIDQGIAQRRGPFKADVIAAVDIREWYERNTGERLCNSDWYTMKTYLAGVSWCPPQQQYRVPGARRGQPTRQIRLRCVRNAEKWASATAGAVVEEYLKGLE